MLEEEFIGALIGSFKKKKKGMDSFRLISDINNQFCCSKNEQCHATLNNTDDYISFKI